MIQYLRMKSSFLAGIWLVGLIALATLAAQTPVQIHPAPPPDVQRPITIAVLADGFTQAQEGDFKDAAANFLNYGLLLDPDFEPHKDLMTIKTIFKPAATASTSQFGFVLGTGFSNCSVHWDEDEATGTTAQIDAAVKALNPTHTVVIANHNYNFGCSHDTWSYVAVGAVGEPILEHEFGHLLSGLKDEYVIDALENTPYPGPWDKKNCSTVKPPYWMNVGLPSTPANLPGCALYGVDIVHAFEECKMGTKGAKFCHVCNREMQATWDFYGNPENFNPNLQARLMPANLRVSAAGFFAQQPQQPTPVPSGQQLRLLLSVNQQSGTIRVVSATDVTAPVVPRHRVAGEYVYEVRDGANVIAIGVIPGDPFTVHGYRGGGTQHDRVPGEASSPTPSASVVVNVPGASRDDIAKSTKSLAIDIYKLGPQVNVPSIGGGVWVKLKSANQVTRIAQLTPTQLKEFIVPSGKVRPPAAKEDRPPAKGAERPPVKK